MSLKQQTFSAVRWTTVSSLGRSLMQIVQVAILARLLTPSDFGLMAMVMSVMVFVQIFSDVGISNAIIHSQSITHIQKSSLYWLNVGASAVLSLLLAISRHWIASWYGLPDMQDLLLIAGLTLVVGALAQQHRVNAQKNLEFNNLARVELVAALVGFMTTVSMAWYGCGVFSMAVGGFVTALVSSALAWRYLSGGWRPSLRFDVHAIRPFLSFGLYMIGNNLANTFNSQVDIILGGKLLGALSLGAYSVPKELNLRINAVINPVVTQVGLPVMAKAQGDIHLLKRIYLQSLRMTAAVNCPIYLLIFVFAPEVVHLVLSKHWEASVPLLRILACWALVRSTGNPIGSLLMSCGRADLSFKWNMVWLFVTPPSIWFCSRWGATGMALAMLILIVAAYLPNWYFLCRPLCGAKLGEYTAQIVVPFGLSLIAGGAGFVSVIISSHDIVRLLVGSLTGLVAYLLLSRKYNSIWFQAMQELTLKMRTTKSNVG